MNAREHGTMLARRNDSGKWHFRHAFTSQIFERFLQTRTLESILDATCSWHMHPAYQNLFFDRRNWQSTIYIQYIMWVSRRNSIGSGHVRTKRAKNCKASHEIDDNAGAANAKTFILTQNPKCVFAIARATRDTWPFFTLFQPGGVRWVVMSTVKRSRKKKILPSYATCASQAWCGRKIQMSIFLQSCIQLYFFNFSTFSEYYSLNCVRCIVICGIIVCIIQHHNQE